MRVGLLVWRGRLRRMQGNMHPNPSEDAALEMITRRQAQSADDEPRLRTDDDACVIDPPQRRASTLESDSEMRPARLPLPTAAERRRLRITSGGTVERNIVRQGSFGERTAVPSASRWTEDWPTARLQLRIRWRPGPGSKALMLASLGRSVDNPNRGPCFRRSVPGPSSEHEGGGS